MPTESLYIIFVIIAGFAVIFYFFNKKLTEMNNKPQSDEALVEWLKSMQKSVDETNKNVNHALNSSSHQMIKTLQENSKQLNERLDKAAAVIKDVGKEVGEMSEIGRNMKELQEFLKSPKLRGNIGEQVLKDLISQMFPKNTFNLQYEFKSGDRVDAAIKTDAGILPIDSKFPMENFQKMTKSELKSDKTLFQKEFVRDVKRHIDSISKKYIIPDEGTMDFALMYVPSESVYYELVNELDVMEYARKQRVYPVSPSTLYASLQTILLSFEGKKIESRSREIFAMLRTIQNDYDKLNDNMGILGKHINNASSQFNSLSTGFSSLGNKLNTTKSIGEKVIDDLEE